MALPGLRHLGCPAPATGDGVSASPLNPSMPGETETQITTAARAHGTACDDAKSKNLDPKSPGSLLQTPLLMSIKLPFTLGARERSQTQVTPLAQSIGTGRRLAGTKTCSAEKGTGIQAQGMQQELNCCLCQTPGDREPFS